MNFRSRIKELFNRFNSKLNKRSRIAICGAVIVALLIGVIGIVNHNQQHEIAATGDVATCPVGITVSEAKKNKNTGCKIKSTAVKDSKLKDSKDDSTQKEAVSEATAASSATPEPTATPAPKTEEKKEAAKATPAPKAETKTNSQQNQKKNTNQSGSNKNKSCKVVNHPAVTHQEPVYTIVHHDAVTHEEPVYTQVQTGTKTVVDQAAYDETVPDGDVTVCGMCGAKFRVAGQIIEHIVSVHDCVGRYWSETEYKTVHHDAVTHQEPVYENQQTGTKTVVDKAAYDEKVQTGTKTVTDKAAWQETVCQ